MYKEERYKEIKKVWQHTRFDPSTLENDIAVVELKESLEWHVTVRPVCLPTNQYVNKYEGILMVSHLNFRV